MSGALIRDVFGARFRLNPFTLNRSGVGMNRKKSITGAGHV
jgi:hypothetical protein